MSEQFEGVISGRLERAREDLDRVRDQFDFALSPTA
jgi:hypothetical protein